MRVLLIYSNQSRELVPAPPIGLSYVATATRAAGHEVRVLDLAFSERMLAELAEAIDTFAPEVVGLSVRNIDNVVHQRFESPIDSLQQQLAVIATRTRLAAGRAVPIVLGGPAVSILGARALELFDVDYAVIGEGERAFPALLAALERGDTADGIPGVCLRNGKQSVAVPVERQSCFGQSGLQHWVAWRRYEGHGSTWPIQSKRGCPLQCSYCAYPLIEGRRFRLREPGEVVDEIERVRRDVRPRAFEFVDSTFNVPSRHAIAICEELIRRRVRVHFTAMGINPRDVPDELFPLMKRAGFNSVMITPEAGCDTMLAALDKGFTMREVRRCRERVAAAGLRSMWFFMLGAPGETARTCEETVRFAETSLAGPRFVAVFFVGVRVLPGTALAAKLVESGELDVRTDLSQGWFYLSREVDEAELLARIQRAIAVNPSIVHAAEGSASGVQAAMYRLLRTLRVPPPHWRYLPQLLRLPVLRHLRNRYPVVVAGSRRLPALSAATPST